MWFSLGTPHGRRSQMPKVYVGSRWRLDKFTEEKSSEGWLRMPLDLKLWGLREHYMMLALMLFLRHTPLNVGHILLWHWCPSLKRPKILPKKRQRGQRTRYWRETKLLSGINKWKIKRYRALRVIQKGKNRQLDGDTELSNFKPSFSASWKHPRALSGHCLWALG